MGRLSVKVGFIPNSTHSGIQSPNNGIVGKDLLRLCVYVYKRQDSFVPLWLE